MTRIEELKRHGPATLLQGLISAVSVYLVLVLAVAVTPPAFVRIVPADWFLDHGPIEFLEPFEIGREPRVRFARRPWPAPLGYFSRSDIQVTGTVEVRDLATLSNEVCQGVGQYRLDLEPPNYRELLFSDYVGEACLLPAGRYRMTTSYDFSIAGVEKSVSASVDFPVVMKGHRPRDSPG